MTAPRGGSPPAADGVPHTAAVETMPVEAPPYEFGDPAASQTADECSGSPC